MNQTGIIILAAGNSSRLGRPKQLLHYHGRSFVQHVTIEALKANLYPVFVITGSNAENVSVDLQHQEAEIVYNAHWQEGMASGIVAGIEYILSLHKDVEEVIISVCDQPFLSAALFKQLVEKRAASGKGILACTYGGTTGTPVLFARNYFERLLQLRGEEGAKKLLKLYEEDVATVPFPEGNIDIDSEEDYTNLLNNSSDDILH